MSKNVNFTPNQIKLIDWLAMGQYDRNPPTQADFAKMIGVRPETITRWKRDVEGLQDAVTTRARELLGDDLPDIYASLRDEAKKGSYQHQKLALELTGEYTETKRHELSGDMRVSHTIDQALKKAYGTDSED